ncbi:MAG: AAA family ATPase [Nitrososphaeraceae archaeon]
MSLKHKVWTEKYRPSSITDYIFNNPSYQNQVLQMIQEKSIPHILMSGVQGSGKTTLAFILIKAMELDESDVLIINASDENSVDTVRDKIKDFVSTTSLGRFKVVLLEEADYISQNGQAVMRRLMEEYSDNARFILTCNYLHKIIPAIQSRCTTKFVFKAADKNDIAEYLITILAQEQVAFDLDILDKYIAIGYPDIRSILGSLQQHTINGILLPPADAVTGTDDYKFKLIEFVERDKWVEARKLVCSSVVSEEYEDVYRFMYENINRSPKFQNKDLWEEAIIIIAEHLWKHTAVADAEINFASMIIKLGQL